MIGGYHNCRFGASEGTTLNTRTIKRFSDCHWYVLREFSVVPKFGLNALFSDLIFQPIDEIFWIFTLLLTLAQLFISMNFLVS